MLQRTAPPKGRGRKQERLIIPLPNRLDPESRGDVLVSLSRGLAGKRSEQCTVANDLGLYIWGDQTLGYRLDRTFMGKVDAIQHLVTISHFASSIAVADIRKEFGSANRSALRRIPGTSWPLLAIDEVKPPPPRLEDVVKREIAMIPNDRDLSGSIYELGDDEYVQVESGPDAGVVIWSSRLSVDRTLGHVVNTLGKPSTENDGFVIYSNGTQELSSRDAESLALENPQEIHYVVATHGGAQISWREPRVKLQGGMRPYVEVCYSATEVPWSTVHELMTLTASDNVREATSLLKDSIVRSLGRRAVA